MPITDLSSLRTAAIEWADYSNVSTDRLNEFVQMTTHLFNYGSKEITALRVRDMEEVVTLTPASAICTLPSDYLEYRRVGDASSLRTRLTYITPQAAFSTYPENSAGCPQNFTIVGSSLYMYPTTSSDIELLYYKKLPDLVADSDTNWLLTAAPSLYLHGTLLHLAMFTRDADLQGRSAGLLSSLMAGLTGTDELANYAYAPGTVQGIVIA